MLRQPGLFEQALCEYFFFLRRRTDRRVVGDVAVLGQAEDAVGRQAFRVTAQAVDPGAVAALQVLDKPVAVAPRHLAVLGRDRRKPQADVAARMRADDQVGSQKRNWIAAAAGAELA